MGKSFNSRGSTGYRVATCSFLATTLLGLAPLQGNDPYQIFDRARSVWRTQKYPDEVQYRTTIHVTEGAKDEQEHYNGEASATGDIRVEGISDEERSTPHQTSGINFKINLEFSWNRNAGGNVGSLKMDDHRKESSPDYLGVPMVSPEYSFGLDPLQQPEPVSTTGPPTPKGGLRTIATVNAVDRAYDITNLGTETLDGFYVYHLRLQPRRDPTKYRLRELWIDAYTFQVVKLVTQGNFTGAPMNAVPWEVTFQDIGGAMYIESETARAPLIFRGDRTFTTATITFSEIKVAAPTLPVLPFMDSGQILREP